MGDALDGVRLTVGEVVVGVDAPGVTGLVVVSMTDAVEDRVAQVHVRRRHVDLGPQYALAVLELAGLHAREQVEVVFDAALAERAVLARLLQVAAVFLGLIRGQVADIGLATLDQFNGPVVQLAEIVRGIAHVAGPVEAQPLDVALDRVDVFLVFLGRVGVVESQVTDAAEFLGQAEVHADRLGVADVQVTVGLRRETGDDAAVLARVQVGLDDRPQEVRRDSGGAFGSGVGRVVGSGLAHRILECTCPAWVGRLNQRAYHSRSSQAADSRARTN
ncbi:hypothetical protein D3C79_676360 [compost metagenome]